MLAIGSGNEGFPYSLLGSHQNNSGTSIYSGSNVFFGRNKHLFDDGPEDASVAFVIDAVGERKVDGVVFPLAHTWAQKRSRIWFLNKTTTLGTNTGLHGRRVCYRDRVRGIFIAV